MKKRLQVQTVEWDYITVPDAEARLKAAYDLLFTYPQNNELTENSAIATMPHDTPS
jgi:hypothetical protein